MRNKTRLKNLPRNIVCWNGKTETILELQKTKRMNKYTLSIRNLLLQI